MPKHTHVIEADSAEDFKQQVCDLHCLIVGGHSAPTTVVQTGVLESTKSGGNLPTKKERKKKEEQPVAEAPVEAPVATEVDPFDDGPTTPPPAPVKITFEQIMAKGKEVSAKKGMDTAKGLIAQFGVEKISAVKEADYPAFMAAAEKVLA